MKSFLEVYRTNHCLVTSSEICASMEKEYRPLRENMPSLIPKKLNGLIKHLPQTEIDRIQEIQYAKLISTKSINSFLVEFFNLIQNSPIEDWSRKLELFISNNLSPKIDKQLNENIPLGFISQDSSHFFKQFISKSTQEKNIDKILVYVNAQMDGVIYSLDKTDADALMQEIQSMIKSGQPEDKRQVYAYGPLQRRLDSLARLLSLNSKNSACVALTIHDSKLIISCNPSEAITPQIQKGYFNLRIALIRQFLSEIYSGELMIFKPYAQLDNKIVSNLERGGKLYQMDDQTLKSILLDNFLERIDTLYQELKSDPNGGLGIPQDLFIKDAYKLAVTAYLIRYDLPHPSDCILSLIDEQFSPKSVSSAHSIALSPVSFSKDFYESKSPSPINCFEAVSASYLDHSSPASMTRSSSPEFQDMEMQPQFSRASSSSSPSFSFFSSCATPTPAGVNEQETQEQRQITQAEFWVLMGNTIENNVIFITAEENPYNKNCFNALIQDDNPTVIKLDLDKQVKINTLHAEQLIMFIYLQQFKNIDLRDDSLPKVHIGISKFACLTCVEAKSDLPVIVFTGGSQKSFPDVINLSSPSAGSSTGIEEFPQSLVLSKRKAKKSNDVSSSSSSSNLVVSHSFYSPFLSPGAKKACYHQNQTLLCQQIEELSCQRKLDFSNPADDSKKGLTHV